MIARNIARCAVRGISTLCVLLAVGLATAQEQPASDAGARAYSAAAALQNREAYDLAAEEWASFLEKFPDDPRADRGRHYLGVCLFKNEQYGPAAGAFAQVLADYPEFELLESTHLYLGLTQYSLGQQGQAGAYDEAAATFATLLERFPKSKDAPQALFYRGEALYALGRKADAAALYAQLAKNHADSTFAPDALYALGVAQQELGQQQEAGATFAAFATNHAQHALATEVSMRRGQVLYALGQYPEAEKFFAAAAAVPDFNHADYALLQQAACALALRQHAAAGSLYAAVIERFPQSAYVPAARLEQGKCAYLAGDFPAARAALNPVLAAGEDAAPEAAHWIARSLLKEGQPGEALRIVEQALPQAEGSSFAGQLALDRADALYDLPDRRTESVALYADIAAKFPQDELAPQALFLAAFAALQVGDHPAAVKHATAFRQAFAGHDLEPDVLFVTAESQLQLGQYAECAPLYVALIKAYPQHADAPLWRVRHGLSSQLQQKYAETIAALTPALPILKAPALLAEAQYLIGFSQLQLKKLPEAKAALEASLAADPGWRQADETLLALAQVARLSNDFGAARATLRNLLEKFPESAAAERAEYRLAEYAHLGGDHATAAAEYQRFLSRWPQGSLAPYALEGLGWSQIALGEHGAAEQTMTALLAQHADSPLAPRGRYARGLARQQLKQFAPAGEDLRAFLASNPAGAEKSDARYVLGLCLAGQGEHAAAATEFQGILADDPQYAGADKVLYDLAWAQKDQGQAAESAATFASLAERHAESPLAADALFNVGEHHYAAASEQARQGEADAARAEFRQAALSYHAAMGKAGVTELGERTVHKLAWAQFRQDEFQKAHGTFAYQRQNWPQGAFAGDAAFMQGECLFKQGEFQQALDVYAQVGQAAGPEFAALALLHGGQAACKLKQWEQGLALIDRFVAENPDNEQLPEAMYEQAWAKQNLGQPDEALSLYEQVTARTDREVAARARFMIGEIHFEKKDHREAVRNFFKVAYGYGYPEWQANAHYEAGRCFEVLGKPDQAVSSYQEVVTKFPDSDQAPLAQKRLDELQK